MNNAATSFTWHQRRISLFPRWLHRFYATRRGYFWKACPRCYRDFGGHEWRDINGLPSVVQIDNHCTSQTPCTIGICPACTRAGLGHRSLALTATNVPEPIIITRDDLASHIDDPVCICAQCRPELHDGVRCSCRYCRADCGGA